jgi:hypothetical protein
MQEFETIMRAGGAAAIAEAGRFFMKTDPVHKTLRDITSRLDALSIPYAVAGGMALVAHGYDRTTVDVDLLLTPQGLEAVRENLEGLGYVSPFAGSKNLRDTSTGVRIEFLISGGFPGDGKPKPVAFPDPASVSVELDGIRYLRLPTLVELKLASGMSAAHRLKDLADVQELIKALQLPRDFANGLDPYVREKFIELWEAVRNSPPE